MAPAMSSSVIPSQSSSTPLHTSMDGAPGVHAARPPSTQYATVRRHAPTPQLPSPSPLSATPSQSSSMPLHASGAPGKIAGFSSLQSRRAHEPCVPTPSRSRSLAAHSPTSGAGTSTTERSLAEASLRGASGSVSAEPTAQCCAASNGKRENKLRSLRMGAALWQSTRPRWWPRCLERILRSPDSVSEATARQEPPRAETLSGLWLGSLDHRCARRSSSPSRSRGACCPTRRAGTRRSRTRASSRWTANHQRILR